MSATIGPSIAIEGLTKDYGSGRGVFDVSFSVERGEVFGFLGPNGAGKTVTMRNLMAVSYTHLDVYKRQVRCRCCP